MNLKINPKVKNRTFKLPYDIRIEIDTKTKLRRLYLQTRDRNIKTNLNKQNKKVKRLIKEFEENNLMKKLKNIKISSDPKNWRNIKKELGLTSVKTPLPNLVLKGNIAKTKEKKIEFLSENLKNIFAEPIKSKNIFFEEFVNNFYDKLQEEPVLNDDSLSNNISVSEISEMIKNAKNKKAPGLDNVTNFIIKNIEPAILEFLAKLFNTFSEYEYFPPIYKSAKVIMIHKNGKPKRDPLSYRPLSLTSSIGKIYEKIIAKRVYVWAENNN